MLRISPFYSPRRIALVILAVGSMIAAGCSTPAATIKHPGQTQVDPDVEKIDRIVDWLESWSREARSIEAEGSMTISNEQTQQSGNFTLKTKRLAVGASSAKAVDRVDSVSLEVRGPFGITVIRFLASPTNYALYNALQGETREGVANDKALEDLTQLKGISLQSMDDVIFGLSPSPDNIDPQDSIVLLTRGSLQHILLVYRFKNNYTEALTLDGVIPDGSLAIAINQLRLTRYERWSGMRMTYGATNPKTEATIKYSDITLKNEVPFANTIDVATGANRLLLEFEEVQYNPQYLTVKINIPGRKR